MTGIIYIIQAVGTDRYKIGFTARDPVKRLAELQIGSPFPLELNHFFAGSMREEKDLHEALESFNVGGEWFELKMGPLLEAISYTKQTVLSPILEENLCEENPLEMGDEYGPIKVVEGPHKGCEGFFSEDAEESLWNVEEGYTTFLDDSEKVGETTFRVAKVYLEGVGSVILPYSSLVPS